MKYIFFYEIRVLNSDIKCKLYDSDFDVVLSQGALVLHLEISWR